MKRMLLSSTSLWSLLWPIDSLSEFSTPSDVCGASTSIWWSEWSLDIEDDKDVEAEALLGEGVDVQLHVEPDLFDEDVGVAGDRGVLLQQTGDTLTWRRASGWIDEGVGAGVVLCSKGLSWGFVDLFPNESELLLKRGEFEWRLETFSVRGDLTGVSIGVSMRSWGQNCWRRSADFSWDWDAGAKVCFLEWVGILRLTGCWNPCMHPGTGRGSITPPSLLRFTIWTLQGPGGVAECMLEQLMHKWHDLQKLWHLGVTWYSRT